MAAPFVEVGLVHAAAAGAEHVVGEDELVLRLARLERPFEPLVLGVANGDAPPVAVFLFVTFRGLGLLAEAAIDESGRMPVVVEDYEQGVAPGPGAVGLERADVFERLGAARIEAIRADGREKTVAGFLHADGDVAAFVGLLIVEERALLMVAVHQEDAGLLADQPQERPLE